MSDSPKLLVVDDESSICQACRRVFARQGFVVDESCDPHKGLDMAQKSDYAAILLDIKMPTMDGIEFLETLRSTKSNVPVIFMTGYPSVPSAASAVRLGAAGYVMKPFTPEEITQAVQKMIPRQEKNQSAVEVNEAWTHAGEATHFWHESWYLLGKDGTAHVGAVLPRTQQNGLKSIRLPKIGEVVFQGLPMASLETKENGDILVPAPISGVIVAVNEALKDDLNPLLSEPCTAGWIACVCPTRLDEESGVCKPRRVFLVNPEKNTASNQAAALALLGCTVTTFSGKDDLANSQMLVDADVIVLYAPALGDDGPNLVTWINSLHAKAKVVVVTESGFKLETAYRSRKIFFYAVEPFADNEIADILDAAFRPLVTPKSAAAQVPAAHELVSSIFVTNRNRTKVVLLAAPGLLRRGEGLGGVIRRKLLDLMFPIQMMGGDEKIDSANIINKADTCDRLLVLLVGDAKRLPGSLVRDSKSEFVTVSGGIESKVTTLVIQTASDGRLPNLDSRTLDMLATHIVNEIAWC